MDIRRIMANRVINDGIEDRDDRKVLSDFCRVSAGRSNAFNIFPNDLMKLLADILLVFLPGLLKIA